MVQIVFSLAAFTILGDIISAYSRSGPNELQKFAANLEKDYRDRGLSAIWEDLKLAWAQIMKGEGNKNSSCEIKNVEMFLKKIVEDYNFGFVKKIYKDLEDAWENYMTAFGKQYTPEEMNIRKAMFSKNKEYVEKHNELFRQGKVSYSVTLNYWSDRTTEEMKKMKGFKPHNSTFHAHSKRVARESKTGYYDPTLGSAVPKTVDWRANGYVTDVKVQGECNSCYAFAGIGALEAYQKKKTGNLISLSVQNIIDCTWNFGNNGCDGGYIYAVFKYARLSGVESDRSYPYTMNASQNCHWKREYVVATNNGELVVSHKNELTLKHAVAKHGPVATSIGGPQGFENYGSGVYHPSSCGPVVHSVLVVGYGTDPVHGDYWIIKNRFWLALQMPCTEFE